MFTISNSSLAVVIAPKGAELQSIYSHKTGIEYMWSGAAVWPKKSPVLFPVVGGLKNGTYQYNDHSYPLNRHGFARDMEFEVTEQQMDSITFLLTASAETRKVYPFEFTFFITYSLNDDCLSVTYKVENEGRSTMFFSVGAHPAFKVPVTEGTTFNDYYLRFNALENAGRWPLASDGSIEKAPEPFLNNTDVLPLNKPLFYNDALVFKHLASTAISIVSDKHSHGITLSYNQFPYMGIWSAKDADFVCIEPWCGIADTVTTSGLLQEKEGINALEPKGTFERSWNVKVF